MIKKIILGFIVVCSLPAFAFPLGCRSSCEYQLGLLTYQRHDYARAFNQFLIPAKAGNPAAQYKIGYMYYYGFGIERDQDQARDWIRKSAAQNYPCAIKALDEILKVRSEQSRT